MPNRTTTYSCYFQNVRGLNTKVNEFYASASLQEYDFIGIAETWLTSDVLSSELFPEDYSVLRSDRDFRNSKKTKGGGVLLAYKNKYAMERVDFNFSHQFPMVDFLAAKCIISGTVLFFYVLYIPPDTSNDDYCSLMVHLGEIVVQQTNVIIDKSIFNRNHHYIKKLVTIVSTHSVFIKRMLLY
nr:unnamed protein product [Callosobruchus chinensis]